MSFIYMLTTKGKRLLIASSFHQTSILLHEPESLEIEQPVVLHDVRPMEQRSELRTIAQGPCLVHDHKWRLRDQDARIQQADDLVGLHECLVGITIDFGMGRRDQLVHEMIRDERHLNIIFLAATAPQP